MKRENKIKSTVNDLDSIELAMPQSTLTTSSPSSLKNNLQPPYELWSFFFLLSAQLQSWIWIPYIKTFFWLSLVTQLQQNTSLQMAGGLQTQTVYSFSITEFIVPSAGNLHTRVLQYNHDYIITGHFGQNKTLELVCYGYSWPSLCADIQQFCKSCVTCM